jgi:heme exporter protein B
MATHVLLARTVRAVLTKDVRIELRSREVTTTAALFGLLVALVAAAAFGGATTSPAIAAAGTLWTSQLFAAVFAFARFWHRERDHRAWTTTKLLAGDPLGIFVAKVIALFLVLVPVGLVGLAVTALFLHVPADGALARAAALLLLAFVGFAALGTLFGLLTDETKARHGHDARRAAACAARAVAGGLRARGRVRRRCARARRRALPPRRALTRGSAPAQMGSSMASPRQRRTSIQSSRTDHT